MGRKIPPANDGSNYYTARKGNRIEGVSFEQAILDEADFPGGDYARVKGQHTVDLSVYARSTFATTARMSGKSSLWTTIAPNSNTNYTIPAYTTVPNVTLSGNMINWTTSNNRWVVGDLTPQEQALLQEQYTVVPDDHEFNPNVFGQCDDCPQHNMYRRDQNSHLFVIQEPPSQQDWLDQLAS